MRLETPGGTPFIISSLVVRRQSQLSSKITSFKRCFGSQQFLDTEHGSPNSAKLEGLEENNSSQSRIFQKTEFDKVRATCPELESLSLAIKRLDSISEEEFQEAVIRKIKNPFSAPWTYLVGPLIY